MRVSAPVLVLLLVLAGCGSERRPGTTSPPPTGFDLAGLADDALPAGFEVCSGAWHGGAAPDGARGLLQDSRSGGREFNVVLAGEPALEDVEISVTVHPVSGEIDRGGGPVWRAGDGRNYYVARWNPLEDNFRAYKVVDGVRTQIATANTPGVAGPVELRVRMVGSRIEGYLGGELLLEVKDDTFPAPGRVGLWTKADARTVFADLEVRDLAEGD